MRKISSRLTPFYTKFFWLLTAYLVVGFFCFIIFKFSYEFLFLIIYSFLLFFIPTFFISRKLKIVFLGKDYFQVDDKKIPFKKIKSIRKNYLSASYIIKYEEENQNKKFRFLPKFHLPFYTLSYIKEVEKIIKQQSVEN